MPINIFGETGHIQAEIIHENIHKCTCLWKVLTSLFFLYASRDRRGFGNLMFLLWFALLGGFFLSSSMWVLPFCSFYSPFFFSVLWFIYDWQGLIINTCYSISILVGIGTLITMYKLIELVVITTCPKLTHITKWSSDFSVAKFCHFLKLFFRKAWKNLFFKA
jgi:hypothetical protein